MRHQTLAGYPETIAWLGHGIMDWAGFRYYDLAEPRDQQITRGFGFDFDRAIASADGQYAFIYQALGTKGILLKDGEMLREINRSYYHAATYEYPAAFATVDGVTYLVHCPVTYRQLDFEAVETGVLVTNVPGREPADLFHSRLEVSPQGGYLLSKGWYWHPWDVVKVFDIRACLHRPHLLDGAAWGDENDLSPRVDTEVSSAGFVSEQRILLFSSSEEPMDDELTARPLPPRHLAVYDLASKTFSPAVPAPADCGNVFPISEDYAWDLFRYPKIIRLQTGEIVDRLETLATGFQCSSIMQASAAPAIAFNPLTKQIAVKIDGATEVLSME